MWVGLELTGLAGMGGSGSSGSGPVIWMTTGAGHGQKNNAAHSLARSAFNPGDQKTQKDRNSFTWIQRGRRIERKGTI